MGVGVVAKRRKSRRKRRKLEVVHPSREVVSEPTARKWWDQTAQDVEEFLSAYSSELSHSVKLDPKGATIRFSPPLARDIVLEVSLGDDYDFVNLHAEHRTQASGGVSGRRLSWNSHPFCYPCPPRDLMVASLFLNLSRVLRHKVRLREKRLILFRRFLLHRHVSFEFYDNDEWRPVPNF